ncbi:MAG TPA: sterol desaturase family protein [Chitinophagaceae bacterium]|nr:sterol desaturase family protein [Chitinophagaceae bacterium]
MNAIVEFFDTISPLTRSLVLAGGLVLFWILEGIVPLFNLRYRKWRHAGLNLFFTFTTVVVNFAFAFLIVKASAWAVDQQFGLLYLVKLPLWLFILLGLMIMDLISAYWIHYIQHQVKWMWKFHLVHHTDTWVDTTTANRHHPGESVFRAAFTLLAVVVTGAPLWMVFLYQSLSAAFSQFNHANIRFPRRLDTMLSWFIVSPNMHKVHHHNTQPLTDTNYGNIFSIWDRLFGTFAYVKDINTLQYGIDTHPLESEHNSMSNLLKIPFQQYRAPAGSKFSESSPKPEN